VTVPGPFIPSDGLSCGLGSAQRKGNADRESEFSHGRGLVPPHLEDAPPSEGGRYRGRTPPAEPKVKLARGEPVIIKRGG
jgi:hypothetical protein